MFIHFFYFRYLKSTLGNIRLIGMIRMDDPPAETNEKKVFHVQQLQDHIPGRAVVFFL